MKQLIILMLLMVSYTLSAQNELMVMGGEKGNYILNAFKIASGKFPNGNTVGYKLERSENNGSNYELLKTFATPQSLSEFKDNYKESLNNSVLPNELNNDELNQCWIKFSKYHLLDSIREYLNYQGVLLSLNLLILDNTAQNNKLYNYKLSAMDDAGNTVEFKISQAVSFPDKMNYTKPIFQKFDINESNINIIYKAPKRGKKPNHFCIYRKQTTSKEDFEKIQLSKNIYVEKDSWVYAFTDINVTDALTYFYCISPSNQFGNYNILSDTSAATSMETKEVLVPVNFKAIPIDSNDAIKLSWDLINPQAIGSVQLYRNKDYEGNYALISTFNAYETDYIDNGIEQGIKYYYYLKITDKYGRNSNNGARIFGLMSGNSKPLSVILFTATPLDKGVLLEWLPNGDNIRGFHLYKTFSIDGKVEPVGQFIEYNAETKLYNYLDTVSNVQQTSLIGYNIMQENNGHIEGSLFEWQYVVNNLNYNTNTMQYQIDALKYANKVVITWENKLNTPVSGYNIYRKNINSKEKIRLNTSEILPNNLSYIDTTFEDIETCTYFLEPLLFSKIQNKLFESNEIQPSLSLPSAPYNLKILSDGEKTVLSWAYFQNTNIIAFEVYKWKVGDEPIKIASLKPTDFKFTETNTNTKGQILYYIKAVNINGESEASNTIELILNK